MLTLRLSRLSPCAAFDLHWRSLCQDSGALVESPTPLATVGSCDSTALVPFIQRNRYAPATDLEILGDFLFNFTGFISTNNFLLGIRG